MATIQFSDDELKEAIERFYRMQHAVLEELRGIHVAVVRGNADRTQQLASITAPVENGPRDLRLRALTDYEWGLLEDYLRDNLSVSMNMISSLIAQVKAYARSGKLREYYGDDK